MNLKMTLAKQKCKSRLEGAGVASSPLMTLNLSGYPVGKDQRALSQQVQCPSSSVHNETKRLTFQHTATFP